MTDSKQRFRTKEPPHSIEAERSALGAIMRSPDALEGVMEFLPNAEAFYAPKYRKIYNACLLLVAKNEPVDITTVSTELDTSGDLESIGGRVHLVDLAEYEALVSNAKHYALIIQDCWVKRRVIQACDEIIALAYSGDVSAEELISIAETKIAAVGIGVVTQDSFHFGDVMPQILTEIDGWVSGEMQKKVVATGFPGFDKRFVGFMGGDLVIIGGKPSQGKTQLAVQISMHAAKSRKEPVLFVSMEMPRVQVGSRFVYADARVNSMDVKRQALRDGDFDKITKSANRLAQLPIYFADTVNLTINALWAMAHKLKRKEGLGLVVVDYLQLMHPGMKKENRQQEVAHVSRMLKALALALNVPVVALSQFSNTAYQRDRASLGDLRDSGAISQDADDVLFVWESRDERQQYISVEKMRNGERGDHKMLFIDGRWEEPAFNPPPEPALSYVDGKTAQAGDMPF